MEISHNSTDDAAAASKRSNVMALINLVFRTLTTVCLLVALIVIVTNNETYDLSEISGTSDYFYGQLKIRFHDIVAYRFMLSASVIGILYSLAQIVISTCGMILGNYNNQKGIVLFNFYGDKVLSYLLMAGAAAGLNASLEVRDALSQLGSTFVDKGIATAALLLGGFLFSAGSSIISSYALRN